MIQLNKDISTDKNKVIRVIEREIEEIIAEIIEEAIEKSKKLESEMRREDIDRRSKMTCRRRYTSSRLLALTTILSRLRRRSDASDYATRVVKNQQSKSTTKSFTHNFTQRKLFEIYSKTLSSLSHWFLFVLSTRYSKQSISTHVTIRIRNYRFDIRDDY